MSLTPPLGLRQSRRSHARQGRAFERRVPLRDQVAADVGFREFPPAELTVPAEPQRARCGRAPGRHPREARHAPLRALVRHIRRRLADNRGASGAARGRPVRAYTEKRSPASCAPASLNEPNESLRPTAAPRRARSARLLSIGTAVDEDLQAFAMAQQGLQRLTLRRVAGRRVAASRRQRMSRCCSQAPVAPRRRRRFVRSLRGSSAATARHSNHTEPRS